MPTGGKPFSAKAAAAADMFCRPVLTHSVRWIVSFSAGGGNDTVARLVGQFLSENLGQQRPRELRRK
jgi:tripartite-type tricarboxylate transporter receptor subunit TctC